MTITIPAWALWALAILIGAPVAIVVLVLAWFGLVVAYSLSKGGIWR